MGVYDWLKKEVSSWFSDEKKGAGEAQGAPAPAQAPQPGGPGGGPTPFGNYVDGPQGERERAKADREKTREDLNKQNNDDHQSTRAKMIGREYFDQKSAPSVDPLESVGKLETKEDRLKALGKITQNTGSDQGEHMCGPASLVGAMIYADGAGGVAKLVEKLEAAKKAEAEAKKLASKGKGKSKGQQDDEDPVLTGIKQKLADKKELDQSDIHALQVSLYEHLKKQEQNDPAIQDKDGAGVDGKTIQDFIQGDKDIATMFRDKHMSINFTDTDGDKKLNHFVLAINDPDRAKAGSVTPFNTVYDPYARKGGQVVTEVDQVQDYDFANRKMIDADHTYLR